MNLDKIKIYLLQQILKNFLLIFFIFLSVAWLLQITRLFTLTNFLHIEIYEILLLSIYIIPNLITIIVPFILIFSLLLCFIKLNRDNELISILTLGIGLKPFKYSLIFFGLFLIIIYTILNFYLAPKIYEIYKKQEYELRNTIDFNKISFSNFINLNDTTILDFKKKNNGYEDIFISFKDENENFIYAKKGNIFSESNQYNFKLTNGFKISINKNKQIEKLEFLNYVLKIDDPIISNEDIIDKNTFTIFDDIAKRDYINIGFKFFDIILIFYILYFFYNNNLKEINLKTINNIFFSLIGVSILIANQILKNSEINLMNYLFYLLLLILISIFISKFKKRYE